MKKQRIYYSKDFKYQTLLEVAKGRNFEEILRSYGYDIDSAIKKDKKYCSKLLYKWRKELYGNNKNVSNTNSEATQSMLNSIIQILNDDDKNDIIMAETKSKIMQNVAKYKNLKNRIISAYKEKYNKIKK